MSEKQMYLHVVGELYHPNRTSWPERSEYNYRGGAHELRLFLSSPTESEIEGVVTGVAEFGLFVQGSAIFFLHKFGDGPGIGMPWSDSPYSWWLVPPDERQMPNPEPENAERIFMFVALIDADTGILRGMRACTLSPEFSTSLHDAIRRQARSSFDDRRHAKDIERAYREYPTTDAMAAAAVARCIGGD